MEIWSLAAVIGLLSLDTTAVGQFMVSRPIVVGPLIGLMMGDPVLGLSIGALIELIWIGQLPVGNVLPLDLTLLTALTASMTIHMSHSGLTSASLEAILTFALIISIPLAALSTVFEMNLRRMHKFWVHKAQSWAQEGKFFLFETVNWIVLLEQFLKGTLLAAGCLGVAHGFGHMIARLSPKMLLGLHYAHWFLLALGCAAAIDLVVDRKAIPYLVIPAIVSVGLLIFLGADPTYLVLMAIIVGFLLCYQSLRRGGNWSEEERPEKSEVSDIPIGVFISTFIRSFFLQAVWNFERGLNYGVAYTLAPILKFLFPEEERSRSMVRHLDYFNTQPYLASFIIGSIVRMEVDRAQMPRAKQKQVEDEISALKLGMTSPLAAIGDNLFWATIRPYCALVAVSLIFTKTFNMSGYHLLVPAVFLLIYNAAHVGIRLAGLVHGLRLGDQTPLTMRNYGFQEAITGLKLAGAVLIGVLIVLMNSPDIAKGLPLFATKVGFFAAILGLYTYALHRKIDATKVFYGVVLFALVLAYWPEMSAPPPPIGETMERGLLWMQK